MALGSQSSNVDTIAALTGLTHDIFVGTVKNAVRRESVTGRKFRDAGPGDFKFAGNNMTFAVDLRFNTGAGSFDGNLPDYVPMDATQGQVTPIRRACRIALDNLVELRASGEGSFEDLGVRIQRLLWSAWRSMEIFQAQAASSGQICEVSSRTSSTVVVVRDGYDLSGTNPIQHLSIGALIGWYDVSAAAVGGAGEITALNESTNTVTVTTAGTWEPSAQTVAGDTIFFVTTPNTTTDYFTLGRNLSANGLGTIVDPTAAATTVFNIAEGTRGRWKPYRKASVTFDHLELTEHWLQLSAHRGFDVNPNIDCAIVHPSAGAQLARSILPYQQQMQLGGQFQGGYSIGGGGGGEDAFEPHTGLMVAGIPVFTDTYTYHNVATTLCTETLYRVTLGGEADFWQGDGSMWRHIEDFDGKEAHVVEYMNYFSNHRGSHGALTGVSVDVTVDDFSNVANY